MHSQSLFDIRLNADEITTRIRALYDMIKWIKRHYTGLNSMSFYIIIA